ncbi:MAG: HAD-IIB family hydrolase [Clostridia bacterium]|nr:HAD-IIB family hydrolase [Clostridia bacterium]
MLRMIACDLDGTLLPKGEMVLSGEVLDTVRYVTDKGAYFAVCSGRPYHELRRLFQPVHNRIIYISHDGALAMLRNCVQYKRPLVKSLLEETIVQTAEKCEGILFMGKENTYCPACKPDLYMPLRQRYGTNIQKTENLNAMGEELLKLCYYKYKGEFPVPEGMRIAFQDSEWLELTCGHADKGRALHAVCRRLGVDTAQVAAFGDGENDLPMFAAVGHRYAVSPKCEAVIQAADEIITDVSVKIKEIL